ncbi:3-isopropylmalate dehydratase small subunit [Limnothrix redekei LRLZ20PSL1]|uniref:3-isopropylmalate dehydratase n=1 Tax=Limnothrix redekei LRLZ20PSL1 TaxID=3112953 RepID=A0ABW7CHA4_9CYAN
MSEINSQVQRVSGTGLPLRGDDIDTDRIIPARFLRCVTFDGLGEYAFADDRTQLNGEHPFDQAQYQGAKLLVVNRNFGCGSSREHAPQAIARWGIGAIVGESFAEIFFSNCVAIGIPCVTASHEDVLALQGAIEANPSASVSLDLVNLTAAIGDLTITVTMKEGPRQAFLSGMWDSCGQLVSQGEAVQATAGRLPYLAWA